MPIFDFRLLGAFEAKVNGQPVTGLGKPRQRSLLAYLLLHGDQMLSRHALASLFWPESKASQARTNLRNLLHRVRHGVPESAALFLIDTSSVCLNPDADVRVDVTEFERVAADMAEIDAHADGALEQLERAWALYQGPLLPGCRDDWVFPMRERLSQFAGEIADDLAREYEHRRDLRAAIRVSRDALAHHPGTESVHRRLMRLQAANGDRAAALRSYHACAEALRELGAVPSKATEALVTRLRAGVGQVAMGSSREVPLVGRLPEWGVLTEALEGVTSGEASVVCLTGEAGLGKTRLAQELLRWAHRQGIDTASAHCYSSGGRQAFAPVAGWFRAAWAKPLLAELKPRSAAELIRILPELHGEWPDLAQSTAIEHDWQRNHFFAVLTGLLRAGDGPLLLLLDDVQWCDESTLDWLHHSLCRTHEGRPVLLVMTQRPGASAVAALEPLRVDMGRKGRWTSLPLSPLNAAHSGALVASLTTTLTREQIGVLCTESEGNPLFLVELTRAGWGGSRQREDTLPERLRSVISGRLSLLGEKARGLVQVAALMGREVHWEVLRAASPLSEVDTSDALDELWEVGLLREQGAGSYRFSHDKFREVAVAGSRPSERRTSHRRIANALVAHSVGNAIPWAQIAIHRQAAGDNRRAVSAHLNAAASAGVVFANAVAVDHLQQALALMGAHTEPGQRATAAARLGELLLKAGRGDESRQVLETALEGTEYTPVDASRLHRQLAAAWSARNRYDETLGCLEEAERVLDGSSQGGIAEQREHIEVRLARLGTYYWLGDFEAMAALANGLSETVATCGTVSQQATFHMHQLNHLNRRDRYAGGDAVRFHSEQALVAARQSQNARALGEALFLRGFTALWCAEFDLAASHFAQALSQGEKTGHLWLSLRCRTYQATLCRYRSDPEFVAHIDAAEVLAERLKMSAYVAAARANRGVIALRNGEHERASDLANQALLLWADSAFAYPFQWFGLLIQVAVFVENGMPAADQARADDWVARLLDPKQHRLPPDVAHALAGGDLRTAVTAATRLGLL